MPPPKSHHRKLIGLPPELAARVTDYRFRHRLPSEVAAIRQLIEQALDAAERAERKAAAKGRRPGRT